MNSASYGGQRSQHGYEAPACVQNAMMTKDKKPFTYTPGGIDLSQIKSERMAKRLARNAQAEGAATRIAQQNRPSPGPAGPNGSNAVSGNMGAAAMGMPFQVLPPPPPPPPVGNSVVGKQQNGSSSAPPPPPSNAGPTGKLAPPNLGSAPNSPNMARKSPTPQRFEPPPMGFRPEIKIPPNPMAALRKVPPPVEKNTFWKDEYVKERSKSPMPGEGNPNSSQNNSTTAPDEHSVQGTNGNHSNISYERTDGTRKSKQDDHPLPSISKTSGQTNYQQQQYTPTAQTAPEEKTLRVEIKSVPMPQSPVNAIYTKHSESPCAEMVNNSFGIQGNPESSFRFPQQRAPLDNSPLGQIKQPQATPPTNAQPRTQTVPWRTQSAHTSSMPNQQSYPKPAQKSAFNKIGDQSNPQQQQQKQQQQYSPVLDRSTQSQPQNQEFPKPSSVGSLYIAPLEPKNPEPQARQRMQPQLQQQRHESPMRQVTPNQSHQLRQQPARWMTSQPQQREQPEWVRPEENGTVAPSSLHRLKSPPPPQAHPVNLQQQSNNHQNQPPFGGINYPTTFVTPQQNFGAKPESLPNTGLWLQINTSANQQSNPRERIIPIQLEQTPTYSTSQPNFNVVSQGYIIRSPNQFVDQGYNNFPHAQRQSQPRESSVQMMSPTQHLNSPRLVQQHQQLQQGEKNARVVPIIIQRGKNENPSQSTVILANEPRSPPIQSKSFRVLQKITDTGDNDQEGSSNQTPSALVNDAEPQLHRPQFSRQTSANQTLNSPTVEQMQRMNIGHNQETPTQYIHPSQQKAFEPKKYTGSAIPSKSFKILQAMTTPENAGPGQSDL